MVWVLVGCGQAVVQGVVVELTMKTKPAQYGLNFSVSGTVGGTWLIVDMDDEDAPMVSISFHNEFKDFTGGRKLRAVMALLHTLCGDARG